jgi:hypothetical protein
VPFPFFEASLRSPHPTPILGPVFLGENLAPPGAGDGGILMLERRRLGTLTLDSLICTPGGFHVLLVRLLEKMPW